MAKDPICGMTVDERRPNALKLEVQGTTYYFCCERCRTEFRNRRPSG